MDTKPLVAKVELVDEVSQMTPRGDIQGVKRVRYSIGDHGPFFAYFTDAEYTPENVNAKLDAEVRVISALPY